MTKLGIIVAIAAVALLGCQSTGPAATDAPVSRTLSVNGTTLAYVEEGRGDTIVFVHGAAGDWRTWDGLRPHVAREYRFVSMSRRYHFPNAWDDKGERYTFDQHVEDIAAFIRALNVGKVHLVGSSYSGRLAGYVALKYPELLRSVVLGEPSLAAPADPVGKAAMAEFGKDLNASAAAAKAGRHREAAILLANAVLGDPAGFDKWTSVRQQRWLDNQHTVLPMVAGPAPKPVTCEQLQNLRVPALVVRGEKTRDSYRHGHDALVACLGSRAEVAVIPNAMHTWGADQPELAARVVRAFVARH